MTNGDRGVILVTGLTGLIGGAVAEALVTRGDAVLGLDRVMPAQAPCRAMVHELGDAHRLHAIMRAGPVRAIVHAGGASGPMVWPDNPARVAAVNIGGLVDVLEAARLYGVGRVVWFSSILAYGQHAGDEPLDECVPLHPDTVYGATKAAGEALLKAYAQEHGVDGVALRVVSCYGPGRTTRCFIRELIEDAQAGRPTRVPDPGARNRQHIHRDDVVAATLAVLDRPHLPSRAYNIGPGVAQTSQEVADAVGQAIPGVRLQRDPAAVAWNSFAIAPLGIERARRDLGFAPRVSLADGAARYRTWLAGIAA